MLQRLAQWFKPTPAVRHLPEPSRFPPMPITPRPRETFPHKPDSLPAVQGFKFRALLLDGRVLDGEVSMLGSWRVLLLKDPAMPASTMRAESHSLQGWRHA